MAALKFFLSSDEEMESDDEEDDNGSLFVVRAARPHLSRPPRTFSLFSHTSSSFDHIVLLYRRCLPEGTCPTQTVQRGS